jgi:tetratricopeptide (TPR) repeat protein
MTQLWDASDPQATIDHFKALVDEYPGNAFYLYEYAGAFDFAGREAEAAPLYEAAFAAGLAGDDRRRGLIQYGSTLRNLGRHDEAVAALRQADEEFPGHASVKAFLALALTSAGRGGEAVALLLNLAVDRIDAEELQQYRRPLREYAAEIS